MASNIDETKPTATTALTADVRANFSAAKTEIEALQTDKAALADLASTDTDDGAALVGFKQTGAGAVDDTVQGKLEEFISIDDYGADPAETAADNKTAIDAALAAKSAMVVPVGDYTIDDFTIPASKTVKGDSTELSKIDSQVVLGSDVTLNRLTVESSDAAARLLTITAGASRVTIDGCELNTPAGYTSTFDMNTSSTDLSFINNIIAAQGYGVLLNNAGVTLPGGKRMRVEGNYISSVDADAVEINTPAGVAEGLFIIRNFLETTAASGPASAGFAAGISDTEVWICALNIGLETRREGIHIEGTQKGGICALNAIKTNLDGVLVYGETGSEPLPISLNNLTSLVPGSNNGIWVNLSSPASPINGLCLFNNVLKDYENGIKISPTLSATVPMVTMAEGNSFKDCTNGINVFGAEGVANNRQVGDNFASGATSLFSTTAHASMGGMYADVAPTNIINNAGYGGFMPSSVDKFGYPIPSFLSAAGVTTVDLLIPAGPNERFYGRVRFQCRRSGVADWVYASATLTWDGSALSVPINPIGRESSGSFTLPTWVVTAGGNLAFRFTAAGATTFAFNWVEFDGEYWDS